MQDFQITDPTTGRTITISANKAPQQADAQEIFQKLYQSEQQSQQTPIAAPDMTPRKPGMIENMITGLAEPVVNSVKTIAGGVYEVGRAGVGAVQGEKAYQPGGVYSKENQSNPFLSNEKLQQYNTDPGKALLGQIGDSAATASWAIPFGKGTNFFTKAALPGAGVSIAQEASKGETPLSGESRAWDYVTAGLTGAAFSTALYGLSQIPGKLNNLGQKTESAGENITSSVRKIKQPASVYGAGQEKTINRDLNELGVKGTPSQQYSKLEPTMKKVEDKIQKVIDENPGVVVSKEEIKKSFLENLKSSLRTKDITNKQAQAEIDGYLADLVKASGGKGKFTNIDLATLRQFKKVVNEDYGSVYLKSLKDTPLTPREKVVMAAWDSLDQAVQTASPELKRLLLQESSLFKAAPSLYAARFTPPTFRAFGTSLPSGLVQTGQDLAGRGTTSLGKMLQNFQSGSLDPALIQILNQAGNRGLISNQGQNENNNAQNDSGNYNAQGNFNQVNPIIPQQNNYIKSKQTPKKPTSYNPQMDAMRRSLATTNQFNQNLF